MNYALVYYFVGIIVVAALLTPGVRMVVEMQDNKIDKFGVVLLATVMSFCFAAMWPVMLYMRNKGDGM